jgi:hypothetical protein
MCIVEWFLSMNNKSHHLLRNSMTSLTAHLVLWCIQLCIRLLIQVRSTAWNRELGREVLLHRRKEGVKEDGYRIPAQTVRWGLLTKWARRRRTVCCGSAGLMMMVVLSSLVFFAIRLGEGLEDRFVATGRSGMNTSTRVVSE